MKNVKTGKSTGPDEIPVEMLIGLEDDGVNLVWEIVDKIYETGNFSQNMLKLVFVAFAKNFRYTRLLKSQNHKLDEPQSQSSTEDRSSVSETENYTRNT